jgi:hypothetical protein
MWAFYFSKFSPNSEKNKIMLGDMPSKSTSSKPTLPHSFPLPFYIDMKKI